MQTLEAVAERLHSCGPVCADAREGEKSVVVRAHFSSSQKHAALLAELENHFSVAGSGANELAKHFGECGKGSGDFGFTLGS